MRNAVQCRMLRSTRELEAFAPEWRALWSADPAATPFQSPEWLMPWWRQFGQPDLHAVVLSRAGSTIGFLPFYIYANPDSGERQMLLIGVGTTDYLDGVFAPECTVGDVTAGLELLRSQPGWDALSAIQLRSGSKLYRALELTGDAVRFESDACYSGPALCIAELTSKLRTNIRYYRKRALAKGDLTLTEADAAACQEVFTALQSLHTQRWQERGEPGVLADPRVLAWHREAIPKLLEAGLLRLTSLRLNGEIIAVMYAVVDPAHIKDRTEYFYMTTYSTAHAELCPGTLLIAMQMERARSEGFRTIDMLRGDEDFKRTIWHMNLSPTYGFALQPASQSQQDQAAVGALA